MKNIKLNDGTTIPQIGYGTWQLEEKETIFKALDAAFAAGYTHIDTAQIYNNEYEIGQYIKEKKINPKDIYITTKVWVSNFTSEKEFKDSVKQSLKRLGLKKVNLILLHWAMSKEVSVQAYKWLEEVKDVGLTNSIGVSNFNEKRLSEILEIAKYKPVVNQVQYDVKNHHLKLRNLCEKNNIHIEGYSLLRPYLGSSSRLSLSDKEKEVLNDIGKKYNKTGPQVILKWAVQNGVIIFPKSQNPERIKANIDLHDFKLTDNEMKIIEKMDDPNLSQKMDDVAEGEWDSFLDKNLLFNNHFEQDDNGNYKERD